MHFAPRGRQNYTQALAGFRYLQTLSILANDMLLTTTTRTIWRLRIAERKQRDWRELCDAAMNETDSKKLDSLVQELIRALDEGEQNWRRRIDSFADNWEAA